MAFYIGRQPASRTVVAVIRVEPEGAISPKNNRDGTAGQQAETD